MRDSDGMELFESYLRDVKRSSQNTISSYLRDIRQLSEYLHAHTDADLGSAEEEELCEYIDWMRSNGKSGCHGFPGNRIAEEFLWVSAQ